MYDFTKIHPGFDEFTRLYADELHPELQRMEQERQSRLKHVRYGLAGGVALAIVAAFLAFRFTGHPIVMIIAALAGFLIPFGITWWPMHQLNKQVHDLSLQKIAGCLGMSFQRKGFTPIDFDTFRRYKLLPGYDRRNFEDLITGTRHGAEFYIYEGHLETESRDKDGNSTWTTVFRGQLFRIAYPKKFLGETVIARDSGILNKFGKPAKNFQQVGIASPRFEKAFEAWSTDQVEARELLDPIVLERFLELENIFNGKRVRAAFGDQSFFLAVETGDVMKMRSSFRALDSEERIAELLQDFAVLFNLIDIVIKPVEGRMDGTFSLHHVSEKGDG